MSKIKEQKHRAVKSVIIIVLLITAILFAVPWLCKTLFYPKKYEQYVQKYSAAYGIDESFAYAVINTESGFDEKATSNVGALGLMQIMQDAFEWTQRSLSVENKDIAYDDMLTAQYNIEYGCCMLGYYYQKYGSYELSAAAYHAGTNQVDIWLSDGVISASDFDADDIPSDATSHYVKKVMRAYEAYEALY